MFVASVPMGAGGSGFAFLEMYAAEANYIVRYGSNDRYVTPDNLRDINIIDEANNLYHFLCGFNTPPSTGVFTHYLGERIPM
ncbi:MULTISPECIES: hypothetical protein [unclassified Okeania]|uniref:hypothetical protein n=1 Tax=unclassified Okeania TaxID=2634635 RepID=UPI0013BC04EE|nr:MULTISPECIES: hypothetical protein [unclassified Okeania]NES74714.1 hypothetical protein [Okeania sp. SIO1H4]NET14238.1 hypothetical protein [Okeania sp. SIO1H6]NET18436.1 hypothetical protein [Okeania sp. SIO1H5]NET96692.1 hypothetical protein [Okeania sp. SIO1H2]